MQHGTPAFSSIFTTSAICGTPLCLQYLSPGYPVTDTCPKGEMMSFGDSDPALVTAAPGRFSSVGGSMGVFPSRLAGSFVALMVCGRLTGVVVVGVS